MSIDRIIKRIIAKPGDVDISDVIKVLGYLGYQEKWKGGECIFHKKGANPICVPTVKGRKIKEFYVRRLIHHLKLEERLEEQSGR